MRLNTPEFWYNKPQSSGLAEQVLSPLSYIYKAGARLRSAFQNPVIMPIPVICIGNLTMGGSGKTPACLMLYEIIRQIKGIYQPGFLSKGYGRKNRQTLKVQTNHSAEHVGDEALVLAAHGPTYVSASRAEGAELALRDHTDCLILDDGYQSRDIVHDINILVINSYDGLGNERVFPAGPLREPASSGFERADIILYINDPRGRRFNLQNYNISPDKIFECSIQIKSQGIDKKKQYIAFTGIGRPEKFFETLRQEGLALIHKKAYPDHHAYTNSDFYKLHIMTKESNAQLITTEKDYVKLRKDFKEKVYCLEITMKADQPEILHKLLESKLQELE